MIHTGLVLTLIVALFLARPIAGDVAPRDWFVLGSPLLFLGLGWYDELVYHHRRALHREDILHTISHLAAAVFLVSLFVAKVFDLPINLVTATAQDHLWTSEVDLSVGACPLWCLPTATRPSGVTFTRYLSPVWQSAR